MRAQEEARTTVTPAERLSVVRAMACRPLAPPRSPISWFAASVLETVSRVVSPPADLHGDPASTVERYIHEFKNAQRFSVFPRLFAPGFRHHFSYVDRRGRPVPGDLRSWVETGMAFLRGFPDVKVTLHELVAEGDLVLERNTAVGTHRGPFHGRPATGRMVSWSEEHVYRVQDGRIVENWPTLDFDALDARLTDG